MSIVFPSLNFLQEANLRIDERQLRLTKKCTDRELAQSQINTRDIKQCYKQVVVWPFSTICFSNCAYSQKYHLGYRNRNKLNNINQYTEREQQHWNEYKYDYFFSSVIHFNMGYQTRCSKTLIHFENVA